jgi:endoglucanase
MRTVLAGLFIAFATFVLVRADTPTPNPAAPLPVLGHGLNLGNFLEAPKEGAWEGLVLKESDFSTIAQAGFTLIRVPIRWSAHTGPAPDDTIDPAFFNRIDWVVAQAEQNHLTVILDYHNDDALMKFPDANGDRFVATWKQIAEHYQGAPASVLFELLNEPNGKLDAPHWNALLARTLAVVRVSNPDRGVVVGPVQWNNIGALPKLALPPDDRHLIVTVHYYDPMKFTHQGASWIKGSAPWLGTTWEGTDAEKLAVTEAFDRAAAWGKDNQRPMYLGEFGSFNRGDLASRARWTAFVARTAEAHGLAWTYWEFCAGFGVYDPKTDQWRQPLLDALLPKP